MTWVANEVMPHGAKKESSTFAKICQEKEIEGNLSRICREVVELEERMFLRREKHIKMNAISKQLNQRSNQHVKLSKHLSTK